MSKAVYSISIALVCMLALAGCAIAPGPLAVSLASPDDASDERRPAEAAPAETVATSPSTPSTPSPPQPAEPAATSAVPAAASSQELSELFAIVQSMRDLSPTEQDRLMQDLKQTDPKLWPLVTQQFRASLAYRQKQQTAANASAAAMPTSSGAIEQASSSAAVATGLLSTATNTTAPAVVAPTPVTASVAIQPVNAVAPQPPPAAPSMATTSPSPPTVPTSSSAVPPALPAPTDWRQPLNAAIASLEQSLAQSPGSDDRQVYLRLLHLMAGQRDQALEPIAGRELAEQEFWSKELYAMSTLWDVTRQPDYGKRVTEAAIHFEEANGKLREVGLLVIRNLAFCTEVNSYGVYKPFAKDEFRPDQRVVLYAEVENYVSQPTPQGFHTVLHGSYQIFDSRGAKVVEQDLPPMEEHCQNPRRDFFVAYSDVKLPAQIYDGRYTLKLSIEDTLGNKVAQSSIDFNIRNEQAAVATR